MNPIEDTKCPKCEALNRGGSRFCAQCATPLPFPDQTRALPEDSSAGHGEPVRVGDMIAGRYKIIDKLGSGGMGVVYKAEDQKLTRLVALKFLPPGLTCHQESKMRFIQEAQSASILDHPNICTIHEIDELANGQMYIAMSFYEGETLRAMVQRGCLPVSQALNIMTQVAEGLAKAHSQGIVHRDIKPANIMVTNEGAVKILDFGLAKLPRPTKLTQDASLVGTVAYMSPEQGRGEEVDERTDLWSWGVVFYEMLTARHPFPGDNERAILQAIMTVSPLSPREVRRDIPEDAERIVWKCLGKEKGQRYPKVLSLLQDLNKLRAALEKTERGELSDGKKTPEARKEIERRQATVIFAEVIGYDQLLKSLDPEDAALVMNRCFGMFEAVVRKYGAQIAQITAGNLMILFGVPSAIENAPQKAARAALELLQSLQAFNHEEHLKVILDLRMGIDSGTVITQGGESEEYGVMGEAVQQASQLKDLAGKGQILLSPGARRYTEDAFAFERLKPVIPKGGKTPIPLFRLISAKEDVSQTRIGAERMIHSAMVGRDKEIDQLEFRVLKVVNGEGGIVNIVGEAGIGKSRLIAELIRKNAMTKTTFLVGRALSIGKNLSFHPIIDILKSWARINEDDPPAASAQKLETAIHHIFPEGAGEAFPFIATMMGMKLAGKAADRTRGIEGEALEMLILKNLRDVLIKMAEQKPVVFAVEDLHWADRTSLETLESLCRLAESHRILFLNICRPNYPETSGRFLEVTRSRYPGLLTEIVLEPLKEDDCDILIDNLLNITGLPAHVRNLITQRAEGNPFFIEEVARSLIDEGAVEIREGRFHVTDRIDSVVIPETIHDILMGRIDRLEEKTRSLLKIASVIGRSFFHRILTQVAGTIPGIDDRLEFLEDAQLIKKLPGREELEYSFTHTLVQEVAYESILLKTRKELHLRVAAAIEAAFAERLHEFYGMLAVHYSRGENLDKAEEYLVKAGEEALKSAASNEALHFYQEALRLYCAKPGQTRDPETIARLEWNIAKALLIKGRMAEAVIHFDKVLNLWGERRPRSRLLSSLLLLVNLVKVLRSLYLPGRAVKRPPSLRLANICQAIYQRGTALVTVDTWRMVTDSIGLLGTIRRYDLNQVPGGVSMYASASALFFYSGISFPIAHRLLAYARSSIDPQDRKSLFIYEFYKLALDALYGDWDVTLKSDAASVDQSIQDGDLFTATAFAFFLGVLATEQGRFPEALEKIRKLEAIGETYENNYAKTLQTVLRTKYLLKTRNTRAAVSEAEGGGPLLHKAGQKFWALHLTGLKASAHLLQGDLSEADKSLGTAESIISQEKRISPIYVSSCRVSRCLRDLRAFEDSLRSGQKAESKRTRGRARRSSRDLLKNARRCALVRTEAFRLAGVYDWLVGKPKRALGRWTKSIEIGERLQARPELARTYFEIGRRLPENKHLRSRQGFSAEDYLMKAHVLFESLNLTDDLDELDRARGKTQ